MRQTQTLRQKMLAYACAAIGRLCRRKRKLLVVAGAGASIDFGMPSVNGVADILSAAAQDRYPLPADSSTSLYKYFENTVLADWQAKVPPHLQRTPTFEEILYVVFALAATFPAGRFTSALGAFVTVNSLPNINWYGRRRMAVDQNVLREFGHFLVDTLLNNFRDRCRAVNSRRAAQFAKLRGLFAVLGKEFDISVVTLNYDDVVYRAAPRLETGFDSGGRFVDDRIAQRHAWPCILHLHGSVHFDIRDDHADFMGFGGLHDIHWQDNLDGQFHQNAEGRSSFVTVEGTDFPTSAIVAG
jgi:hypothetical protein